MKQIALGFMMLFAVGCTTTGIKNVRGTSDFGEPLPTIVSASVIPLREVLIGTRTTHASNGSSSMNGGRADTLFADELVSAFRRRGISASIIPVQTGSLEDEDTVVFEIRLTHFATGGMTVPSTFQITVIRPPKTTLARYEIQMETGMGGYKGTGDELLHRILTPNNQLVVP